MSDSTKPAVPRLDSHDGEERAEFRDLLLKIGRSEPKTVNNNFNKPELLDMALQLEVKNAEELTKDQLILALQNEATFTRRELEKERATELEEAKPKEAETFDLVDEAPPEPQYESPDKCFHYRCTKCHETALTFREGWDPTKDHYDEYGDRIPFAHWPFIFHGPEHMRKSTLRFASTESPKCHFCQTRIPLFAGKRRILPRAIVHPVPQEGSES